MANDGHVTIKMLLEDSGFNKSIREAKSKTATAFKGIASAGTTAFKGVQAVGTAAFKGIVAGVGAISTALTVAGVAVYKYGTEFESAFAGVKKTVDATEEQLATLRQGILDMSETLPASASDIAAVAEAAGQLGIQTDSILSFSKTMIDLGESTNLTANDAATQFARFANVVEMSQDDFDKLGSVVVDLGNNLATTESEIVDMAMRLAGAGKQVGMSEADIMAFAGALSSVGIESEMGGSAMSKLMVNMKVAAETGTKANDTIKKTGKSLRELQMYADSDSDGFKALAHGMGMTSKELKDVMDNAQSLTDFSEVLGMTSSEFSAFFEKDATAAIAAFVKGLETAEERGLSTVEILDNMGITEVRMRDTLLRAAGAGDLLTKSIGIANDAWKKNTALSTEAGKRYETVESQVSMLKNQVKNLGISAYDSIKPFLSEKGLPFIREQLTLISDAFDKGGFEGIADTVGTVLSNVTEKIIEYAPKAVDAATNILSSIIDGLSQNTYTIIPALESFVDSLFTAFDTLLPKLIPIAEKIVPLIVETVIKGEGLILNLGLKIITAVATGLANNADKLASQVVKMVEAIVSEVIKSRPKLIAAGKEIAKALLEEIGKSAPALKPVTKIIGILAENIEDVTTAVLLGVAAFKAYKTAVAITSLIQGVTKALEGTTIAQIALNTALSLNPWGVAAAGAVVFAGAVAGAYTWLNKESEATATLNDKLDTLSRKMSDRQTDYENAKTAAYEKADADLAEIGHIQDLWSEMQTLVDENGKVKQKDQERVDFIISQLNPAIGGNIKMINGQVEGYKDLQKEIDNAIEKEKAQIMLDAESESYKTALTNVTQAQKGRVELRKNLSAAEQELSRIATAMSKLESDGKITFSEKFEYDKLESQFWDAKNTVDEARRQLSASSKEIGGYYDDIERYEKASALMLQGKTGEVIKYLQDERVAYSDKKESVVKDTQTEKEAVATAYADSLTALSLYQEQFGESESQMHKDNIADLQIQANEALTAAEAIGLNIIDGMISGLENQQKQEELNHLINGLSEKLTKGLSTSQGKSKYTWPGGLPVVNGSDAYSPIVNGSHANGLLRVPYDGYIAELHKGERVLTAEEAAALRSKAINPMSRLSSAIGQSNTVNFGNITVVSMLDGRVIARTTSPIQAAENVRYSFARGAR